METQKQEKQQQVVCQRIEQRLREEEIAYGNPDLSSSTAPLWRISPKPFLISAKNWYGKKHLPGLKDIAKSFVDFYLTVQEEPQAFYFRLDCTITEQKKVMLTEWNLVPVGEAGVAINRRLYSAFAGSFSGHYNPFPGNIDVLAWALSRYQAPMAIVIPKSRRHYTRDYVKTAELLRAKGIEIRVERNIRFYNGSLHGEQGSLKTVMRVFQKQALNNEQEIPCCFELRRALNDKKIEIFPQFSPLESKLSMAKIFSDPVLSSTKQAQDLRKIVPWTWPVNPDCPPVKSKQNLNWWSYFMSFQAHQDGFVLKPCTAFGSRNIVFSKDVGIKKWRKELGRALLNWMKKREKWVIQEMLQLRQYPARYSQDGRIVATGPQWRIRFCITGVWLNREGVKIGDVDATLCENTRVVHQQPDCIFLPTLIARQ